VWLTTILDALRWEKSHATAKDLTLIPWSSSLVTILTVLFLLLMQHCSKCQNVCCSVLLIYALCIIFARYFMLYCDVTWHGMFLVLVIWHLWNSTQISYVIKMRLSLLQQITLKWYVKIQMYLMWSDCKIISVLISCL